MRPATSAPPARHRARSLAAGLLILSSVIGAAACSDDDEVDPGLPKDEYVEQAVTICEAGNEAVAAESAELDLGTTEGTTAYIEIAAEQAAASLEAVRELDPPADDAEDLDADLQVLQQLAATWAADPSAATGAPPADATAAAERLTDYGLGVCVTPE
jgi:hypothetical protein